MAGSVRVPKNEAEFRRMVANKERAVMEEGGFKVTTRGKSTKKRPKKK